ncbi:MAG: hypothetical protein OHK0039_00150 [Bacteroidia bacterium]
MLDELTYQLAGFWESDIARAYAAGRIPNAQTLLAELYRHLAEADWELRMMPQLHFLPANPAQETVEEIQLKQWLLHYQPGLLVCRDQQVYAALDLNFSPDDMGSYRRDMRRLMSLQRLAGRVWLLTDLDPYTGRLAQQRPYLLHQELWSIYAIVTRAASFGLVTEELLREYDGLYADARFLHLTAAIYDDRAVFRHATVYLER